MDKTKIAVMGAAGRMGRELIRAVHGNEACALIGAAAIMMQRARPAVPA